MAARRFHLPALAAAALLTLGARPARADEDPRRKQADAIYNEGLRLHDQHKEADALDKFQKAFDVYPTPNILFNIARQEQLVDKPLLAIRHYREAMKSPLLHPTNASLGKLYVTELEVRLARVELVGPPGLKVRVNNGPEIMLPATEPVDVELGTVVVTGKLGEARYDGTVVAQAGHVERLELKTTSATARPADPIVEPPPASPSTAWGTGQYVGVAMWAGAAVAAGVGVGFTLGANSASNELASARASSPNPDSACFGASTSADCMTRRDAYDSRVRDTNIAVGSFIGAGALVVAGTVAFFAWPSATSGNNRGSRGPTVAPIFGKQERGLELKQEF